MPEHEHGHAEHGHEHGHEHGEDCCGHDHGHADKEHHGHDHGHVEDKEKNGHEHSHGSEAPAGISDAVADLQVSKTDYSQQLKGSQSYYYWHGDAERRRQTGEQPVPVPLPKKLAANEAVKEKRIKPIDRHQFLDDGDIVKVFIPLEGDLLGATMKQVEAEFTEQSLLVTIDMEDVIHRFWIDRLAHRIDPLQSKAAMTKSGKLVVKMRKRSHMDNWRMLRGVA